MVARWRGTSLASWAWQTGASGCGIEPQITHFRCQNKLQTSPPTTPPSSQNHCKIIAKSLQIHCRIVAESNASQFNFPGPSKVPKSRFLAQFHYFWWSGGICENRGFVYTKHPFWKVGGTPGEEILGAFLRKRSAAPFGASLLQKFSLN